MTFYFLLAQNRLFFNRISIEDLPAQDIKCFGKRYQNTKYQSTNIYLIVPIEQICFCSRTKSNEAIQQINNCGGILFNPNQLKQKHLLK